MFNHFRCLYVYRSQRYLTNNPNTQFEANTSIAMARHLMAVCVVCLLCADHLPCKQHFEETASTQGFIPNLNGDSVAGQRYVDTLHLPNGNIRHFEHDSYNTAHLNTKRRGRTKAMATSKDQDDDLAADNYIQRTARQAKQPNKLDGAESSFAESMHRTKRHAGGHHHHDESGGHEDHQPAEYFVKKLFERFGNVKEGTMDVGQFELMMKKINLYRLFDTEPDHVNKKGDNETENCISSMELVRRVSSVETSSSQPPIVASKATPNITLNATSAASPQPNLVVSKPSKKDVLLNAHDLTAICPILLYQLSSSTSLGQSGCIDPKYISPDFGQWRHHDADDDSATGSEDRTLGEFHNKYRFTFGRLPNEKE